MAEHYFRQLAQKVASRGIDIVTITLKATSDSDGLIITDQGCIAWHDYFVCVRICSQFSFPKDVSEKNKIEMKHTTEGKCLCKEISQSC